MKCSQKALFFIFTAFLLVFLITPQLALWGQKQFLDSLTHFIAKNTPLKNFRISYQQICWGGFSHPLSLSVHQVEILDDQKRKLSVEKLYIGWILSNFWKFYLSPSWISLKNGQLEYDNQRIITTDLTLFSHSENKEIRIDHFSMTLEELSWKGFFPPSFPRYFPKIKLPLEGSGHLRITSDKLSKLDLTLSLTGGNFTFPPYFPLPVVLDKLHTEMVLNSPQQIKTILTATMAETNLRSELYITLPPSLTDLWQKGGQIDLHISGNVKKMPVDRLSTLWPVGLAEKPRRWVTTHLSEGLIDGTLNTQGTLTFSPHTRFLDLSLQSLSGNLHPTGVTVTYLGDLPKVKKTNAHCFYTQQQFIINNITGSVNNLELTNGHIIIDDLHKEDQSIEINLNLMGNIARTFEIISAKPLCLLQKLGLSLSQPDGLSRTWVLLKFPLETDIDFDQIHVEANSRITNAQANLVVANYPLRFKNGNFDLSVDRHHLYLSGSTKIKDTPVTLKWTEYFKNAPVIQKVSLEATKSLTIGNSDSPFIKGKLPIQLSYEKDRKNKGSFHLQAQLHKLILNLPWFGYQKSLTEPALFELKLYTDPENSIFIQKGCLNGKDLNMEIKGEWGKKTKEITTSILKVGETQGKLRLTQKRNRVKLQGHLNKLDVFSFLYDPSFSKNSSLSFLSFDGDICLKLDHLVFSNAYEIKNTDFTAQLTRGELQTVYLKDKEDTLNFTLSPLKEGIQTFNLEASNTAELFELFAPGNDLRGGKINFVGSIHKTGSHPSLEGEIDIKNLTVHKAPLLAKILSLSSIEGIVRHLSGDGLKFDHGHAYVNWQPGELLVHHAHLTGKAVGLTFTVIMSGHQLNLRGELIPLYPLNNMLSKIPVIGEILKGHSDHAVFSTPFIMFGDWKNPDIQIQPFITLAPGGIRRIFHENREDNSLTNHKKLHN